MHLRHQPSLATTARSRWMACSPSGRRRRRRSRRMPLRCGCPRSASCPPHPPRRWPRTADHSNSPASWRSSQGRSQRGCCARAATILQRSRGCRRRLPWSWPGVPARWRSTDSRQWTTPWLPHSPSMRDRWDSQPSRGWQHACHASMIRWPHCSPPTPGRFRCRISNRSRAVRSRPGCWRMAAPIFRGFARCRPTWKRSLPARLRGSTCAA